MLNTFSLLDSKSADCFGKLCDLTFMFDEKDKEIRCASCIYQNVEEFVWHRRTDKDIHK